VALSWVIEGELVVDAEVKILGRVRADVIAGGKVEIWNGGELVGNVKAASLDIEEGAFFTGTSEMVSPDGKPRLELERGPLAELEAGPAAPPTIAADASHHEDAASEDEALPADR